MHGDEPDGGSPQAGHGGVRRGGLRQAQELVRDRHGTTVARWGDDGPPAERRDRARDYLSENLDEGETAGSALPIVDVYNEEQQVYARAYRPPDLMTIMLSNGTIGADEARAGRAFRRNYEVGRFDSLRAPALDRIPGLPAPPHEPDRVLAARRAVMAALEVLGGLTSAAGRAAVMVLGEGRSIREFARAQGFGGGGHLGYSSARKIVLETLAALAAREREKRRGR